jgi:hypothetical protein
MEYTFKKTGEKIKPERWQWGVIYKDGTEFRQFGKDGYFHQIGEVEQDKVKLAVLFKTTEPNKRIDIVFQDGMKIIHKYRNIKPFYMKEFVKVYMWGYKKGKNYHFNFVLPDDRIVMSNKDNIDLVKFELQRG